MGASAAVVCLGGLLVACGAGSSGGGYVAVQRPASGPAVAPTGDVELVPLEKPSASKGAAGNGTSGASPSASGGGSGAQVSGPTASTGSAGGGRTTSPSDADSGSTGGSSGGSSGSDTSTGAPPATPAESGPAALTVGAPERESADQRWCERVTVVFRNTGGTAVRSGTVTFGTHIIGLLGIDWATIESAEELPVPIAPGAERTKTWTVCVDAWRVPLGMHIETRDVAVEWK